MKGYHPMDSFGADSAETYDDNPRGDEGVAVALLAELAGPGPALELAIGTGRIALPLAAKGIRVDGIDLSPDMVAQLRKKPGGEDLAVTMGDFADVGVDGEYKLIYVVYNTLFNLLTQDDQVRCFENVAKHLTEDGLFLVEAGVPNFGDTDQHVRAEQVNKADVWLDLERYDPATQVLEENHVHLTPQGIRFFPVVQRLAWPSELDLMARIAGLKLKHRWGGWEKQPFAPPTCVSVYERNSPRS
ncbi:methyltransferase [Lentzea sp. NBRC 105346]|uniref:class I SAM-dependent DNA methyltransferase n=1 Tax=Lentzea sp. NBRC 105346 TaxID=3032205 RepID=UPI0024A28596|nr:class I SAM-dependent methyltransferase [Lentzea sp. NBRC 105346]GLZ33447.1 methyltransferase [Lentzea sp. NBRC 105346]